MRIVAIGIAGIVALIGGALVGSAHAADMATKMPAQAAVTPAASNWAGWYFGINAGPGVDQTTR